MKKALWVITSLLLIMVACSDKRKFDPKKDEPLFAVIDSNDELFRMTVEKAQSEINWFQNELNSKSETAMASVKIRIPDNQNNDAFIWLINPSFESDTCVAEVFEIPAESFDFKVGDKLRFHKKDVQDWYILDQEGKMKGGYSLRYMRQKLSRKDQIEFDKYIGVKVYL